MAQIIKDVVTWLKQWFYTEDEIDVITGGLQTQINNKADSTTVSSLSTALNGKADKNDISETDIKLTRAYNVVGITTEAVQNGATQKEFNAAVNTEINALKHIELITVVTDSTLPTASAETMNHLYVKSKTGGSTGDGYDIWVTIKSGSNYSWEKLDDFDLQNITMDWSGVSNKPSTFPPEAHAHGYITSTGKIANQFYKPLITNDQGTIVAGEFGTTSGTFAEGNHSHTNKADKTAAIGTTITLVNKGETNEGCIIFNTIS